MRILVTGHHGQVSTALQECGAARQVTVVTAGRPELDLAQADHVNAALAGHDFDVVVNAAAYTAVDKAETDNDAAMASNAFGAAAVAKHAAARNVPLIHLSTDYVYGGDLNRPYVETDATGPLGVYGASKLRGEILVQQSHPSPVILRTSWVYSPFGANFLRTMLRLGETRDTVSVVADQQGSPTSALDIADAIISIAQQVVAPSRQPSTTGVFHLSGSGHTTWADFATVIFSEAEAFGRNPVTVKRISTAEYPTPARRPANSRLDTTKLEQTFGINLPAWQSSTKTCVARLLEGET